MDYAIYKTIDGQVPKIIHRFAQSLCNHQAKRAAHKKLDEMRHRALNYTAMCRNLKGTKYDFEYDFYTAPEVSSHIRFYIEPIKERKRICS